MAFGANYVRTLLNFWIIAGSSFIRTEAFVVVRISSTTESITFAQTIDPHRSSI